MSSFDFSRELIDWYLGAARDLPWRRTKDPYAIWVSEIMLQQTRVEAVKPYYHRFLKELPDVPALAEASEEQLHKLWEGLGYYSRVRNMQRAARTCMELYGGVLPPDHDKLLSLCGIGEYTAAAVSSIAFGIPAPAIDGNVLRVMGRYLAIDRVITDKDSKKEIRAFLSSVIPWDRPGDFNSAMMELGATLCGPDKAARCGGCPLVSQCRAFKEGRTDTLPVKAPRAEKRVEKKTVLLLRSKKGIALEKRPPRGLLAGLWQPPMADGFLSEGQVTKLLEERGCAVLSIEELPPARHVFTHIVWEMKAFALTVKEEGTFSFFGGESIKEKALPSAFSAYRKYIEENSK
ncbi:MAG: A/G-specific adenine glycosylase [Clostridia bacterium]|nr:A/G-specific adenine glycosylase [Clostridia bacterium]